MAGGSLLMRVMIRDVMTATGICSHGAHLLYMRRPSRLLNWRPLQVHFFSLQVYFSVLVIAGGSLRSGDLIVILSFCCFLTVLGGCIFLCASSCLRSCCGADGVTMVSCFVSRFVTVLGSTTDEEHLMSWMIVGNIFVMRCRLGISE